MTGAGVSVSGRVGRCEADEATLRAPTPASRLDRSSLGGGGGVAACPAAGLLGCEGTERGTCREKRATRYLGIDEVSHSLTPLVFGQNRKF